MEDTAPRGPALQEKDMYLRNVKFLSGALPLHPHFVRYLEDWARKGRAPPEFHMSLRSRMKTMEEFNFVYPVRAPDFIHAYKGAGERKEYIIIEPHLSKEGSEKYTILSEKLRLSMIGKPSITSSLGRWELIHQFLGQEATTRKIPKPGWLIRRIGLAPPPKIYLNQEDLGITAIHLEREMTGRGALAPLVSDPYLNELISTGAGRLEVVHKVWGTMEVGRRFKDPAELDELLGREAARPGPTEPPEHPLRYRTSRGTGGLIHR